MQLKKLSLTNFRAFKQAEFEFQPGMNLIVGVNGVGKSTVLDALRIMLSQALPQISASKSNKMSFKTDDIHVGDNRFEINLDFSTAITPVRLTASYMTSQESFEPQYDFEILPNSKIVLKELKKFSIQPLVIYFSPRRSLPEMKATGNPKNVDNQSFAFIDSLEHRELRLHEFAAWFRAQSVQGRDEPERIIFDKNIEIFNAVVSRFLDNCSNLRVELEKLPKKLDKDGNPIKQKPKIRMLIDKGGMTLDVFQLSDGERGILSIVLDIARRLSYAGPFLSNPVSDGTAIVLIDELDLHLHPRWQRDVVEKLTRTFPNCQFIATTHSPQIVGEVSPENIIILDVDKAPYRPDRSLGMDTNWILRHLMETPERTGDYQQMLDEISSLIADKKYDLAMSKIQEARSAYVINDEIVRLQAKIERIKFLGK